MDTAQKPTRRAFSLIEAAIVLAIVGVVIGGIWVAVSTVRENLKESRHLEQILFVIDKTKNLWSGQAIPNYAVDTSIFIYMRDSGAVPEDMLDGRNPWGGTFDIKITPGNLFQIVTRDLSYAACTTIVLSIARILKSQNTISVFSVMDYNNNNLSNIYPNTPYSMDMGKCSKATTSKIFINFL